MKGISIIMPVDKNRLDLLNKTLDKYFESYMPREIEFLLVTRSITPEMLTLRDCIRIIPYEWNQPTFSMTMALNIGVKEAKYSSIIITSPEVIPKTEVLKQLEPLMGKNIMCQVFDANEQGVEYMSLVNTNFRSSTPAYHFLAMFNKADIMFINGWDEDFMYGQAYDDDDFGSRFSRAGFPWEMHDEIQAVHQYHPRNPISELWSKDNARYQGHIRDGVIRVKNGIIKLDEDNEENLLWRILYEHERHVQDN